MKKILLFYIFLLLTIAARPQTYTGDKFIARTSILSKGTLQANGLFNSLNFKTDSGTVKIGVGTGWAKSIDNHSIFIGDSSGQSITIGTDNTGVGKFTLNKITTGFENTAIGYMAGKVLTGNMNLLVGSYSGYKTISGNSNTFIGDYTGFENLTGTENTYIGRYSGGNSTGNNNIFIGFNAGAYTVKSNRLAIGSFNNTNAAGDSTKSIIWGYQHATTANQRLDINGRLGSHNMETNSISYTTRLGIFTGAAEDETDYRGNTLIGFLAGNDITTGYDNVILGSNTGEKVTTGYDNVILGSEAGDNITEGAWNTLVGYAIGQGITTGTKNIIIGNNTGSGITTNSSNIVIGTGGHFDKSNRICIGSISTSTAGEDSTKNLFWGYQSPTTENQKLYVNGDVVYEFRHAAAYRESITYTPNIVQNVYFKLLPTFTTSEADGITVAGDSITIVKGGDYLLHFNVTLNGGNGEDWRFKLYKNNAALNGSNHISTTGAGNYVTLSYFWYVVGLTTGDDLCFKVTNTTNSNDPTITDIKFYIRKEPEN